MSYSLGFKSSMIIVSLIVASCASTITRENSANTEKESNLSAKENYKNIEVVYNNELVFEWVDQIEKSIESQDRYSASDTIVRNIHWPDQMDTIRRFEKNSSSMGLYITPEKSILLDVDLYDKKFPFSQNIAIGNTREEVGSVIGTNFSNDTLKVMEEDGYGLYFQLYFKKDKLYRIQFHSVLD